MILIYVSHINPRITYITQYIFKDILGVHAELTINKEDFKQYSGPKINYSFEEFSASVTLSPNKFIYMDKILPIDVEVTWVNQIPVLFHECADVDLPFDPFSAAFFMVSRYEEYMESPKDKHGRYMASSSIAYKNNFLEIPVVNYWAMLIKEAILKKFPGYSFPQTNYLYIPTIDVDVAYAYLGRGIKRTAGALLKNIYNTKKLVTRIGTLTGRMHDPYDTFDYIKNIHAQYNLRPVWFFQVGNYGRYDKNISPNHPLMQNLIERIGSEYSTGLHPSYNSNSQFEVIHREKIILENILNKTVSMSRQHFLRIDLPRTYQVLQKCGILEDYSMGYAEIPGFRAGTSTPFPFYDLTSEKVTDLKIIPFCIMDGTLNQYMNLSTDMAMHKVKELNNHIRKTNGIMVTLWHNQSFSETHEWKGWKLFYNEVLNIAN